MVGYFGLDITAIAIFAAILAFILSSIKYSKNSAAAAAAGGGIVYDDDYDPLEDDD